MSKKINLPIDEILVEGAELIPSTPAKTVAGKILRWVKKIIFIKNKLGIKIK